MGYRLAFLFFTLCYQIGSVPVFGQQATKQDTLLELVRRIDILTEEIEKLRLREVAEPKYESRYGMGPAASKIYQSVRSGVSLSGYGEVVYQNLREQRDNGERSSKSNQIDFLRHVTYLGFRFNDRFLFNSEIEFEHAKTGEGSEGEVAVEFGYIEATLHPAVNFRAGMVLVPVGIINESHEPSTFHGVLRPETERRIIPTTWRANGFGFLGAFNNGIGFKLYVIEGLYAAKFSSNGIRGGRQNGSKALAEDLAITGRLNYNGINGLDIGGSFYVGNSGQDLVDDAGKKIGARLSLFSLHLLFAQKGLELRGFYAQSNIADVTRLNRTLGLTGSNAIGGRQRGYYLTVAYDVLPRIFPRATHYLAPFIQIEKFNTQDSVPTGFAQDPARNRTFLTVGLTYKPHPNIAFKFDYINRDNNANTEVDQFNLAVNYLF
ncbi:MAG: hypothetical protein ACE5HO_02105 [bacterium]